MSGWLDERQRNGGIDEVPLPGGAAGRLWLCGKHLIGPDPEAVVERVGADAVVCLNPRHELAGRYDDYLGWLAVEADQSPDDAGVGMIGAPAVETDQLPDDALDGRTTRCARVWFPIADLHAPDAAGMAPLLDDLQARLAAGQTLVVHCGAGIGRAGTVAAALLIGLGESLDDALATVAASRPMAGPQDPSQLALLRELSAR